ncbi:MAG: ROK family protein [Candidatus Saccharibacteria bacterium]|nr:ROK family protein [Candidatus Saccharibacteria bacterium]
MYLAIDIGGTKTLIALFSKRGRVLRRIKFKTAQGSKTFIANLVEALERFHRYKIKQIIVAIPGTVQKNYSVHFGNRNWDDIDLMGLIKKLFSCPIRFENDASLATLFEGYRLSGKTVFLTFSTGIGGGITEKNQILPESSSFEPGHWKYVYNGKELEWEDIAAASALEKYYHVDYATNLRKKAELQEVAKRVYLGLPDIVKKYHPDTIILGGPLGKIFRAYVKYLPKDLGVKLRRPKRPNESVIYGCYLLAKQEERK